MRRHSTDNLRQNVSSASTSPTTEGFLVVFFGLFLDAKLKFNNFIIFSIDVSIYFTSPVLAVLIQNAEQWRI